MGVSLRNKVAFLINHPAFRREPVAVVGRLLAWRLLCLLGRETVIGFPSPPVRLSLPAHWRGAEKLIYAFRDGYEPELTLLAEVLRPAMVVADVGASVGLYTMVAAVQVAPEGMVFAFEPAGAAYQTLCRNIRLNRLANVRSFQLALSERPGQGLLHHCEDPSRNSLGRPRSGHCGSEPVILARLDDILRREGAGRLDAVKLDAEGAEELVLRGAAESLERWRPMVILEVNSAAAAALGLAATGALTLLTKFGYKLFTVGDRGGLNPLDQLPDGRNVVALPANLA